MAMKPCKKCKSNNWKYRFDDETKFIFATCQECNNQVSFKAKKKERNYTRKPEDEPFAIYEMREDGKYLKTNKHDFIKIGLYKDKKKGWIKVVPFTQANFFPYRFTGGHTLWT